MELHTINHCLPLLLILLAVEANETSYNVTESAREPRGSRRVVKEYSGSRPDPIVCTDEGFKADPNNCAVFYRCMKSGRGKFTSFKFQCAPGTIYDPDTEVCNHPHNTKRSGCGGEVVSFSEESHENEVEGVRQELPSPITTKKPVYTETPNTHTKYPWMTFSKEHDSKSTSITTPWLSSTRNLNIGTTSVMKVPWNKSTKAVTTIPLLTSTRKQRSTTTMIPDNRQQSIQSGDLCISDGFMGDSENCRKFYRCVGNQRGEFIRYEFLCSDTTIWDDDIQSCNHAWAVKRRRCGRGSHNDIISVQKKKNEKSSEQPMDDKTTPKTIQEQLQINYGSQVSQSQTQIVNGPVKQNQTQININKRNETNTSSLKQNQTQISHGSAISQTQMQINFEDKEMQTQLQIDHSNKSSQSQTQIHEMSTKHSTTIQDNDNNVHTTSLLASNNNVSTTECTKNGFMGDRNDCKKFYQCVDNGRGSYTRYDFSCGEGTLWDGKLEACNHAWAVKDCGVSSEYTTISTGKTTDDLSTTMVATKTTQNVISSTQTMVTDENEDVGYGNQNQIESSTSSTTESTTLTSTTTISTNTHPTKKPGNKCTSSGFMGDENDCKKFYRCVDNGNGAYTRYEFSCGEGTVWDPEMEACNHVWAVEKCGGSSISEVEQIETSTDKETVTSTVRTTTTKSQMMSTKPAENDDYDTGYGLQDEVSSSSESVSLTTSSTSKRPLPTGNDCTSNGFVGDNGDCKKFYRCVDDGNGGFLRYEFTCGDGTVWDQKIEACNHAWAVKKCGGSSTVDNKEEVTTNQYITTTSSSEPPIDVSNQDNNIDTDYGQQSQSHLTSFTTENIQQTNLKPGDSQCKNSGFMGDSKNCKKFYRCVDNGNGSYTRYEFTCGEGTVWDSKIEACNHDWAVENCGGTSNNIHEQEKPISQPTVSSTQSTSYADNENDTGYGQQQEITSSTSSTQGSENIKNECKSIGFMGDRNDCKKFYRCVDNGNGGFTQYEFTCGDRTVWDSKIESCNHAWAVEKCGYSEEILETTSKPTMNDEEINNIDPVDSDVTPEKPADSTTTNLSTTMKPGTEICSTEGFVGDDRDCKKFYRCVRNEKGGFIMYEFTCGEGTVWDSEINSCNHARSVKTPCSTGNIVQSTEKTETTTITTSSTSQSQNHTEAQPTKTTTKPTSTYICSREGFIGDINDCKKFYRCVDNNQGGYIKYEFTCGDGTIWDQEIQACNHESSNKCSMNSVDGNTERPSSSTISSTTAFTEQQHSSEVNHISGDDECNSEGFFANSKDCKKFHRCVSDDKGGYIKYEFSCAEGTAWVQDIQACDYYDDENMSCLHNQSSTSKPQPTKVQQTTEETQWQTSTTPNTLVEKPDKQSDEYTDNESNHQAFQSDNCSSEGFYPNQKDCKKFYRCVDNGQGGYTKYDFTCGEGTAWDPDIQTCNHISEVKQCQNTIQGETENKPMQDEVSQTTDSNGMTKTTTTESNEPSNEDVCEQEGYFGNTQDCKKFYRCVDNGKGGFTKYDFDCGEGTIWDQDVTTCNHPQDVTNPSCQESESNTSALSSTSATGSSESSSESQSGSQSSTSSTESSSQSSTNCSQDNSTKKPEKEDIKCEKAGYYPNPNDCKKFYRCVDWNGDGQHFSVYHFDCGEGTIWDPQLETCNHEESVYPPRNCTGTQSQNENIQESSTTTKEDSATTTESTTQQTISSEEPTTQESTASDKTTTQQINTEQTTDTTTSTTSQTTTQQSTTTESTTAHQSSTTDSTTTQQTTTTKSTTTQQPTTTDDSTTTQQTTTTESTTTQQSTTTDSTTSQYTTTTEGNTTTEQSTTSESTTTEQSTTMQGPTTQQSTTTEQTTTTSEATTEQTQQSTTMDQSTTTSQATTEQSTTNEQTSTTTEQSSTQETTAEQSSQETTSTDETTTQQLTTTQESTTEATESNNTSSTTEESTSEQQTTTEKSSDNQSTTDGSTTQATDTTTENTSTEPSSTSSKECPDTEDDQYLYVCPTSFKRHPKYCNMFYQCTEEDDSHELKIAVFTCPNNTIYDESQTQCLEEDKVTKKCDGEIAQKRKFKRLSVDYKEPIVVGKKKHSCSTVGYFPFEENTECSSAFMKCQRAKSGMLRGYVHRCPEGYLYWSISKRCEKNENLKDCRRSGHDWSRRWEIPIERKNLAI